MKYRHLIESALKELINEDAETWDDFDFDNPNDPVAAADFADTFRPGDESYGQRRAREDAEWRRNHPEPARFAIEFMRTHYPDAPKSLRKMAFDKFLDALDEYGENNLDKDKLFNLTNKVISGFMQSKGRAVFDDDGSEADGGDILGMCGRGMHTEWDRSDDSHVAESYQPKTLKEDYESGTCDRCDASDGLRDICDWIEDLVDYDDLEWREQQELDGLCDEGWHVCGKCAKN